MRARVPAVSVMAFGLRLHTKQQLLPEKAPPLLEPDDGFL